MIQNSRSKWLSGVGALVLVGALFVTTVVVADDDKGKNPFAQILAKLDQILNAITGGGSGDNNHTLRWDQALPAATRFLVLTAFGSAAVLDKETGLVWEQSPSPAGVVWSNAARVNCADKVIGGRKGWRTPSVAELASLIDPAVPAPGPTVPPGHPFSNIQSAPYWTSTENADTDTGAWSVNFIVGAVFIPAKSSSYAVWCVRGNMNPDRY